MRFIVTLTGRANASSNQASLSATIHTWEQGVSEMKLNAFLTFSDQFGMLRYSECVKLQN